MCIKKDKAVFLVAEDNAAYFTLICKSLKQVETIGQIHRAEDGDAVLEFLKNPDNPIPDAIILDIMMPNKDGIETLKEIRRNKEFCHLPIIILTTSISRQDRRESYRLCANSYIIKPISYEKFDDVIQNVGRYWSKYNVLPSKN